MLLSLSLVAVGFADALAFAAPAECAVVQVSVTSPAPLATGVPIDVVPAGLLTGGSCGAASWTVTLLDASTGAEVASADHPARDGLLIELDPGGDLAPETTYTLRFEPLDSVGEIAEIGFTTGSGRTVGLDGGPAIASSAAAWSEDAAVTTLQLEVDMAAAAEGASIVAFGTAGGDDLAYAAATGPTTVLLQASRPDDAAPAKICLTARQRDLAGRWSESEEACLAPEIVASERGCFGGGGTPTSGLLGLFFVVGLARRPRR